MSIDNYVTGVNDRSQQRGNLKDEVYSLTGLLRVLLFDGF